MKIRKSHFLYSLLIASALGAVPYAQAANNSNVPNSSEHDTQLARKVWNVLQHDLSLKDSDILVKASNDEVKLTGYVLKQTQAWKAGKDALKVSGVKVVDNELNIHPLGQKESTSDYLSDAAITSKIKAKLLTTSDMPASAITVNTNEGHVVLSGKVKSEEQKKRAEQIAQGVKDVKGVKDQIAVKHI